jgi:hypothetical protein
VLAERYEEWICVIERMKNRRLHFHLLVVLPFDIRTGFDFEAASSGNYLSANSSLRAEWAFWRSITDYDGKHSKNAYAVFGRAELLPVKTNIEGISKYVGKYIAKHIGAREAQDKGVRLVRYSNGANFCGTRFMFKSVRSRLWRWQVGEFARRNGIELDDFEKMSAIFGKRWAFHQRGTIVDIEPPPIVVARSEPTEDEDGHWITLRDIWETDRHLKSVAVAAASGCSQWEAWAHLFMPKLNAELASPQSVRHGIEGRAA